MDRDSVLPELTPEQRQRLAVERVDQAREFIRQAGRMDQQARAKAGVPPRGLLRAALNVRKPGRRGAKARAKVKRLAEKRGLPIRFGNG